MGTTFTVSSDVERERRPMERLLWRDSIATLMGRPVEQLGPCERPLVSATTENALAKAAYDAFYKHYPLVISPDAVWFCLANGFAQHMSLHAEELRHRFVAHDGKKKLVVERPDFFLGRHNPWPEAFAAFSAQIAGHVGKAHDLLAASFSTTGPVERAAFDVVAMDSFQGYFEYEMLCGCGIPSITLTGTADDWRSVRRRAAALGEYGLEEWARALAPVLDQLVRTAEGDVDVEHWRSFFRYDSSSMGSELTGWILLLFPYLKGGEDTLVPNPYLATWQQRWAAAAAAGDRRMHFDHAGAYLGSIPSGLCSAPVRFVDVRSGKATDLRFVAGLFGVTQADDTLALAPEFGWAVVHDVRGKQPRAPWDGDDEDTEKLERR